MDLGSTPGSASISCLAASGSTPDTFAEKQPDARVVKLVDTRDLKSLAGNSVPVQVRPRAPFLYSIKFYKHFFSIKNIGLTVSWALMNVYKCLHHSKFLVTLKVTTTKCYKNGVTKTCLGT